MGTFASFGSSEWLRLAFTALLCIPVLVIGSYLAKMLLDTANGKDGKRKRTTKLDDRKPGETKTK